LNLAAIVFFNSLSHNSLGISSSQSRLIFGTWCVETEFVAIEFAALKHGIANAPAPILMAIRLTRSSFWSEVLWLIWFQKA
jgi:hypothetical protein